MFAFNTLASSVLLAALLATGADAEHPAKTDPRIAELCGADHQNELTSEDDVMPNFAGFFVTSIAEQVGDRDRRIVWSNIDAPYMCSRPAGNPMMHHAEALSVQGKRTVRYLFVPNDRLYPTTRND